MQTIRNLGEWIPDGQELDPRPAGPTGYLVTVEGPAYLDNGTPKQRYPVGATATLTLRDGYTFVSGTVEGGSAISSLPYSFIVERDMRITIVAVQPPAAPTIDSVTVDSSDINNYTVSWAPVSGATGYIVEYRYSTGDPETTETAETNATVYNRTLVCIRVAAKVNAVQGEYSLPVCVKHAYIQTHKNSGGAEPTFSTGIQTSTLPASMQDAYRFVNGAKSLYVDAGELDDLITSEVTDTTYKWYYQSPEYSTSYHYFVTQLPLQAKE